MSVKTFLYVALALGVCYGLLKLAWNVSESVMKPEDQEISQPQKVEPSAPEPKLQTGTAAGGIEVGKEAAPDDKPAAKPGVETETKRDPDTAVDSYYDDSVQSTPGAVKQHRVDEQDPYAPDEHEAVQDSGSVFPTDDRELDRSSPAKPEEPSINPEAYAPDPHEVD